MCKAHKHAGNGDGQRTPVAALRQAGAPSDARYSRHGVPPADADDISRAAPRRRRKDTRRWCKGKPGREHQPVIVHRPWYGRGECRPAQGWGAGQWRDGWACQHAEVCAVCGKVLRDGFALAAAECPQWQAAAAAAARPGLPPLHLPYGNLQPPAGPYLHLRLT